MGSRFQHERYVDLTHSATSTHYFIALSMYEPRIRSKVDVLLRQMKARAGGPVNATEWSMFFTFDTMGAVGFNKEFHMLDDGSEHSAIKALHNQLTVIGILSAVPWLMSLLAAIPGATGSYLPFTEWCRKQAETEEKVNMSLPSKSPSIGLMRILDFQSRKRSL